MPPSDAERVTGWVGVHLGPFGAVEIWCCQKQARTERHRLVVRLFGVLHVEVNMGLLRRPIRPVRGNVVGRELHADPPLSGGVDDAVELSSSKTCPPKIPAQNALSVCRLAASNTTTLRMRFIALILRIPVERVAA